MDHYAERLLQGRVIMFPVGNRFKRLKQVLRDLEIPFQASSLERGRDIGDQGWLRIHG